jgi:hypothetical protein
MELASLLLLVLLPPAEATGATASAIESALRAELGDVAIAIAPDSVVTPAMWQGDNPQVRARFVARISWPGPNSATVIWAATASGKQGGRSTRDLTFSPQDGKAERGRAIGLVLAAMLRESPTAAWLPAGDLAAKAAAGHSHPRFALGAMFDAEWLRSGNWGMGPEATYDFGLSEAIRLRGSAVALFGSPDHFSAIGFGLAGAWDFLRSDDGRHAMGAGLRLDVFHESTGASGDNVQGDSHWNVALGPWLDGRVTVWRSWRVLAAVGLGGTLSKMTLSVGDERGPTTYSSYSRWRPVLALGVSYAL